jgi:hypothetical protein
MLIAESDKYDIADISIEDKSIGLEAQNVQDLIKQGIDRRPSTCSQLRPLSKYLSGISNSTGVVICQS